MGAAMALVILVPKNTSFQIKVIITSPIYLKHFMILKILAKSRHCSIIAESQKHLIQEGTLYYKMFWMPLMYSFANVREKLSQQQQPSGIYSDYLHSGSGFWMFQSKMFLNQIINIQLISYQKGLRTSFSSFFFINNKQ